MKGNNRLCLLCGEYINRELWIKHLKKCELDYIKRKNIDKAWYEKFIKIK